MFQPVAFIIPVVSYFLQVLPRFFNRFFGVDVWTRLLEVRHIKNHNHKIPTQKLGGQFLIDGYFDYPPVFPFMMSFFNDNFLFKYQGFIAPIFDSILSLFIFFVSQALFNNIYLSLLVQFIYLATPVIAIENSYLTPRSLGFLMFTLTFIFATYFEVYKSYNYFGFAVIFASLLFLSHRFATQSYVFLSIFFLFALNTVVYLQILILGFAVACVITKGYYLNVLKGHLYNIYFWTQNLDFRFAHQVRGLVKNNQKLDFVGKIYLIISRFSPIAIFGMNPFALSAFLALFLMWQGVVAYNYFIYILCLEVVFFAIFGILILKTKRLMPIGEGQRYMEMCASSGAIITVFIVVNYFAANNIFNAAIALAVLALIVIFGIIFLQVKAIIKDKNRTLNADMQNLMEAINKMPQTPNVICIPHQNTTMVLYNSKANVLVNADNQGLMRLVEFFPVLKVPVVQLAQKYNLTHALVNTGFATLEELGIANNKIDLEFGSYKLVSLK